LGLFSPSVLFDFFLIIPCYICLYIHLAFSKIGFVLQKKRPICRMFSTIVEQAWQHAKTPFGCRFCADLSFGSYWKPLLINDTCFHRHKFTICYQVSSIQYRVSRLIINLLNVYYTILFVKCKVNSWICPLRYAVTIEKGPKSVCSRLGRGI